MSENKSGDDGVEELKETLAYVEAQVSKVYCYFTKQKLSKCNYEAGVVIREIEQCFSDDMEEQIAEAQATGYERGKAEGYEEGLKAAIKTVEEGYKHAS